jgi:hypothetical protein
MLKKDLGRSIFSLGMLLSLIIGLALLIEPEFYTLFPSSNRQYLEQKDNYINFIFTSLALGGYLIFTPLISVLPAVIHFCDELNTGYYKFVVLRKGRTSFIVSRWLSNAIAGGIATAGPIVLMTMIALIRCKPYTQQMMDEGSFSPLHSSIFMPFELLWGGLFPVLMIIAFAFIFGAVWSTIGLAVSTLIPNRYIGLCAPFILFFFLHLLFSFLRLEKFSPVNTVMPDILPSFTFLAMYQLVLMAVATLVFWLGAKRRLTT